MRNSACRAAAPLVPVLLLVALLAGCKIKVPDVTSCGCVPSKAPVVAVAVDVSGSTTELRGNEAANISALVGQAAAAKAELAILPIDGSSLTHSAPIIEVDFDVNDGGNPIKRDRLQAPLKKKVLTAASQLLQGPRGGSDIFGGVVAAAQYFQKFPATRPEVLAVVSDGYNFGPNRKLWFTKANLSLPDSTLIARAGADGMLPDLSRVTRIYFGGGGLTAGKTGSSERAERVREFWFHYFAKTRGPIPQYAPTLAVRGW